MKNKGLHYLLFILLGAGYYHLSNLFWGTPSWEKNLQIFGTREELDKFVPKFVELRNKYYSSLNKMLDKSKSEKESKETFKNLFHSDEDVPFFSPYPQDMLLDRIRGYAIGAINSDEQYPLASIGSMNPKKLDFKPKIAALNGCFYYYTGAGMLLAAKLSGAISLTPGVEYYFTHPDESAKMYVALRLLGGLSLFATLILVYFLVRRELNPFTAFWATLFLALTPGTVVMTHMVKAHLYGMALLMFGFYFYYKTLSDSRLRNYLLGALFLGLSAGTIITNLSVGIVIFFIELARQNWNPVKVFKTPLFWISSCLFFSVYALTNIYVVMDPEMAGKIIWAQKEYTRGYDEYGTFDLQTALRFLKEMFQTQFHWTILPVFLAGCYAAFKSKSKLLELCLLCFIFLTVVNLLATRHLGVNVRAFAFIAILCGLGIQTFVTSRNLAIRWVGICLAAASILFTVLQTHLYVRLYQEPSNLGLAGEWINANLPPGTVIGSVGQVSASNFPPIQFSKYKIVRFPLAQDKVRFSARELPAYVVTHAREHFILDSDYELVKTWSRPRRLLGIPFKTESLITGNIDLFIFRKV